jgi:hypothetical protein
MKQVPAVALLGAFCCASHLSHTSRRIPRPSTDTFPSPSPSPLLLLIIFSLHSVFALIASTLARQSLKPVESLPRVLLPSATAGAVPVEFRFLSFPRPKRILRRAEPACDQILFPRISSHDWRFLLEPELLSLPLRRQSALRYRLT